MNVELLNLDDFDINSFEPPNFKISENFEPLDDENFEDDDEEFVTEDEDDIEISIDENDLDFEDEFDNVIYSYPFYTKDGIDYEIE